MTERDTVEMLNSLTAIKDELRQLVAEVHGLGGAMLRVSNSLGALTQLLHEHKVEDRNAGKR